MTNAHSSAVLAEFAPQGTLRVALNHGNPLLVGRDVKGEPKGISVSVARALALHLTLDLRFVEYSRAGEVSSDAEQDKWDVCFLATDPKRARTIDFTKPYLQIHGSYLAGPALAAKDAADLVASGVPVGSVEGSAYTLALQRMPGAEHLVIVENFDSLLCALDDGTVEAIAGIHQVMSGEAGRRPGARVLHPPFMEICQAMGVPTGRPHAHAELGNWLGQIVQNGAMAEIFLEHGLGPEYLIG